jgi:hypothetical protein
MKAVLHRHIATDPVNGKPDYESIDLAKRAVTLAVVGEIVTVKIGGETTAATRLGPMDYITFEPDGAAPAVVVPPQ